LSYVGINLKYFNKIYASNKIYESYTPYHIADVGTGPALPTELHRHVLYFQYVTEIAKSTIF